MNLHLRKIASHVLYGCDLSGCHSIRGMLACVCIHASELGRKHPTGIETTPRDHASVHEAAYVAIQPLAAINVLEGSSADELSETRWLTRYRQRQTPPIKTKNRSKNRR